MGEERITTGLKRFLSWHEPIGRRDYVVAGALLMALKFALDWSIARFLFGRPWTPGRYVLWPDPGRIGRSFANDADRAFCFTLLLVALPFVWAGILLTVRRLRSAGIWLGWVFLFFLPWINLLFFAWMAATPARPELLPDLATVRDLRRRGVVDLVSHYAEARALRWRSALSAVGSGVTLASGLALLSVTVLESYGVGLFVGIPFLLGFVVTLVGSRSIERPLRNCLGLTMAALVITAGVLLLFAFEGAICLAMAFPIAAGLASLGAIVATAFEPPRRRTRAACFVPLALAPLLLWLEARVDEEPPLRVVTTAIEVDASAEEVWRHVISFPPLPEPDGWLFRAGIAAPMRATIEGEGVGAVRRCVFTTGAFVEPIDVWDPPRRLRFQVTEQPDPMREWSPWEIHPPHLDGFLVSRQGEFRLEPLGPGRTRLVGTTWYVNRMAPAAYWGLWSDAILHEIHLQVLDHVARLAGL